MKVMSVRHALLFATVFATMVGPLGGRAYAADAASLHSALACACFDGTELTIDKARSLAPASCDCPFAANARKDLSAAVAGLGPKASRTQLALAVEKNFLTRSPEYERMLRYDNKRYTWFLQNVRCTCEGCKATVYFSNCQLSCTPAVVYKRRARIWLAMGFSTDELIDYYHAEHNATHSAREQIKREWLLPKRQKKRGWMVPALLIGGAIFGLGLLLARTVRRSKARTTSAVTHGDAPPGSDGEQSAATGDGGVSKAERNRVLDALDDLEQDGGW
ncbi:MAG: hypothetical protein KC502_07545 [Myxococcales bacterium]|nr:hypothetical protein [Myxococcales bacterium]